MRSRKLKAVCSLLAAAALFISSLSGFSVSAKAALTEEEEAIVGVWLGTLDTVIQFNEDYTVFYTEPKSENIDLVKGIEGEWQLEQGKIDIPDINGYHLYADHAAEGWFTLFSEEDSWNPETFVKLETVGKAKYVFPADGLEEILDIDEEEAEILGEDLEDALTDLVSEDMDVSNIEMHYIVRADDISSYKLYIKDEAYLCTDRAEGEVEEEALSESVSLFRPFGKNGSDKDTPERTLFVPFYLVLSVGEREITVSGLAMFSDIQVTRRGRIRYDELSVSQLYENMNTGMESELSLIYKLHHVEKAQLPFGEAYHYNIASAAAAVSDTPQPDPVQQAAEPVITGYILPDSAEHVYTTAELTGLTLQQARIARNEIYARHGRMFKDSFLQSYFYSCEWYRGTIPADVFTESLLSEIERANVRTIEDYEYILSATVPEASDDRLFSTDKFSFRLPDCWAGKVDVSVTENEILVFCHGCLLCSFFAEAAGDDFMGDIGTSLMYTMPIADGEVVRMWADRYTFMVAYGELYYGSQFVTDEELREILYLTTGNDVNLSDWWGSYAPDASGNVPQDVIDFIFSVDPWLQSIAADGLSVG